MAKITYVGHDGASRQIEAPLGLSVMEVAVRNNVRGIDADCGGAAACATCHVYVDEAWLARSGSRTAMEGTMLEFAEGVAPNSRLACQIRLSPELDGLVVRLPASQH